jgi:ribose transport system substrate-binding protein
MKKGASFILALSLMLSLMATGCSSGASTGNQQPTPGNVAATGDSEQLRQELLKYVEKPKFNFAGESFDAQTIMNGKKIFIIPLSSSNPYAQGLAERSKIIADEIGFEVFIHQNRGTVDEWIQGIETAVSQGYDYIELLGGINPKPLESQIQMARDKGVIVVDATSKGVGYDNIVFATNHSLPGPYAEAGRVIAMYAINEVGPEKINCLVVTSSGADTTTALDDGIKSAFADYAPGKYKFIDAPLSDWATKIQAEVQNALQSDPTINYVIAIYDNMLTYVVPALEMVGVKDKVKCNSYNGSPGILDMVRNGDVDMDLGECLDWMAYTHMDVCMRLLGHMKAVEFENYPLYIWNAENVSATLDAKSGLATYGGYDDVYVEPYRTMWGLK